MQTASLPFDHFNDVLGRLPPGMDLTSLAFETKAIERRRKVGDGAKLLRLALARGPGGLSLSQTATWGGLIGLAELSGPGVKYRLDKAADFLDAVVGGLLSAVPDGTPLCWPGRILRAADGTGISEQASQGLDWRVHGVLDLGRGRFSHLALTDNHGAESMAHGEPVAGEIRIGDRNYARAGVLQSWREQSGNEADFIVRLSWRTMALSTPAGQPFDLIGHLARLPDDGLPHEVDVLAQTCSPRTCSPRTGSPRTGSPKAGRQTPLPLRLVIVRQPPEAADAARKKLRVYASRKQKKLDPRTVIAAGFMILATSLPKDAYAARDIHAAYRLRWQIELGFKRLKSLLHIDQIPTRTGPASRSWLLAHLVLALLCDDAAQDFLESSP